MISSKTPVEKKLYRKIMMGVSVSLISPMIAWTTAAKILGILTNEQIMVISMDPIIQVPNLIMMVAGYWVIHSLTERVLRLSHIKTKEAILKCAKGIRNFVPQAIAILFIVPFLGISLIYLRLPNEILHKTLQYYTTAIGVLLLCLLPSGVYAYRNVELLVAHQTFPKDFVPMPLFVRLVIITFFVCLGSIIMIAGSTMALIYNNIDPDSILIRIGIISLFSLLMAYLNIHQLYLIIVKPVQTLSKILLVGLSGDLRIQAKRTTWDEIGHLTSQFNAFMENLKAVMVKVMDSTSDLQKSGESLDKNVNSTTNTVNVINENANGTNQSMESQSASVIQTSSQWNNRYPFSHGDPHHRPKTEQ